MLSKIVTKRNGVVWVQNIPPDYSPRLAWFLWLWRSGFSTIHEPSCDRGGNTMHSPVESADRTMAKASGLEILQGQG